MRALPSAGRHPRRCEAPQAPCDAGPQRRFAQGWERCVPAKESYRYTAFGQPTIFDKNGAEVATTQVKQPFMWTGGRHDFEEGSGLVQMRLRYYDPAGGRFVSRDPLGLWGDAAQAGNAQGYCGHNPVNRVDPLGLMDEALEKALRKVAESERASEMLADALQEMENLAQKAADNVTQSEAAARRLRDTGQASAADDAARQAKKLRESLEKEITGIVDDVISKTTDPDVVKALKELQRRGGAGSVADILKRLSKWSEGAKVLRRAARGLKLTKGIPLFGALVALLFFPFEVQAKGTGPAAANAIADGFPVLGGTKVVVELVQGEDAIPDKEDRQKPNTPCPDRLLGGLIPDVGGIPLGSDVAPVSGGGR